MAKTTLGHFTRSQEYVGKTALVEFFRYKLDESVKVRVKIEDYKVAYGRERFLVSPISGNGRVWVQKHNVSIINK